MNALRAKLQERGWPVGSVPTAMFVYLLFVDVLAGVVVGAVLERTPLHGSEMRLAAFLAVLAVAFEEGVRRAARLKMRLSADLKRDMTSVWTVATAVALPAGYAAGVVFVLTSYIWFRQHHPTGHPLYRGVFNVALNVLAVIGADLAVHNWQPMWSGLPHAVGVSAAVVVAMVVYTALNRLIPSLALLLNGVSVRELAASREENLIELATLCLGGLVAVAATHEPWLCVLAIAPMITLQRGALVSELEVAASVDAKTGLLNAVAWEHLAQRELARAVRENYDVAVLIVDIDRFKLVNDQYGHLVGDKVLHDVGKVLAGGVREYDTVGRFGGEEFVAVLPNASDADALVVAERLRSRVNELRISAMTTEPLPDGVAHHHVAVSIGVSCSRYDGREVADLLMAADAALYQAKSGGRNRVVLARRGTGGASERVAQV